MGRVNYGPQLRDRKGILSNVTIGGEILTEWTMYRIDLDAVVKNPSLLLTSNKKEAKNSHEANIVFTSKKNDAHQIPTFYEGVIPPAPDGVPKDTFLKLNGWTKVNFLVCDFSILHEFFAFIFSLDFMMRQY